MKLDDYLSLQSQWSFPTEIRFGAGRLRELADVCKAHGIQRPLITIDPALEKMQMAQDVRACLKDAGMSSVMFSNIHGNPILEDLDAGIEVYRSGNHDGVIAMGGGSALDVGKLIAFMHSQTRPVWDFEDREDWWQRANADVIAPVIAIPTTAGTGSEVGRAGVLTDASDHTKKIIFHPKMMPCCVIADAELTLGLPANITAATGMDALSHNLEAYCSRVFHPLAEGIALEGIRLVHDWLECAVTTGEDMEARAYMMSASLMGAVAFQKGLGAMHAMSHPCSSLFGTHHGLTNGVVMPYVLVWNRPVIEKRITALSNYLGIEGGFDGFLKWLLRLRENTSIPHDLTALGVKGESIEVMSCMAQVDPANLTNPVSVDSEDFMRLYEHALDGKLSMYR